MATPPPTSDRIVLVWYSATANRSTRKFSVIMLLLGLGELSNGPVLVKLCCSVLVVVIIDGPLGSTSSATGIFGQPLDQVVSQDQPPIKGGCGTPIPTTPTSLIQRSVHYPTSTSPTSTTSSEASYAAESVHPLHGDLNSGGLLLDSLNISPAPPQSPRSKRRVELSPVERQVPSIVTKAINYLDSKGVKTEGLFRISGAKSRINEVSSIRVCSFLSLVAMLASC